MTFFIRGTTSQPELRCPAVLWHDLVRSLKERGRGEHESGAFLLGRTVGDRRSVERFVLYDDLDPNALAEGYVAIDGSFFATLWEICRDAGLEVIADVHTHPFGVGQSRSDQENPMIARKGHLAIILPKYAIGELQLENIGLYRYLGRHRWERYRGRSVVKVFQLV